MADIVQANHDALKNIAAKFAAQAQANAEMQQAVMRSYQPLRAGAWIGRGSEAFFREMDSDIFPAVKRLIEALAQGDQVTRQISDLLRQADEEASSPFKQRDGSGGGADGGGGSGGDASSDASGGGSGGGAANDAGGGSGGGAANDAGGGSGGGAANDAGGGSGGGAASDAGGGSGGSGGGSAASNGDFMPATDAGIQSMLQNLVQRFDDLLGDGSSMGNGFYDGDSGAYGDDSSGFGDPTTWQSADGSFGNFADEGSYDDQGMPYTLQGGLQPSWDPTAQDGSAYDSGGYGGGGSGGGSGSGLDGTPYSTRPPEATGMDGSELGGAGQFGTTGRPFEYDNGVGSDYGFGTAGEVAMPTDLTGTGMTDSGMGGGGSGGGMGGGEPTTAPAEPTAAEPVKTETKTDAPAASTGGGGSSGGSGSGTAPATAVQSPFGRGIGGMASGYAMPSGSDAAAQAAAQQVQQRFMGGGGGTAAPAGQETVRVINAGGSGAAGTVPTEGGSVASLGLAALSPFAALLGKAIKDKTDKK